MRSRKFLLAIAGLGVLTLIALLGAAFGHDLISEAAKTLMLATIGLLALAGVITQRRTARRIHRMYRKRERTQAEDGPELGAPTPVVRDDLIGMLRLVQAQYVGRLDQALANLERATAHLVASGIVEKRDTSQTTVLKVAGPRDEYVPAVEAALSSGIEVVIDGPTDAVQRWVEQNGWDGGVSLAGPPKEVAEDARHELR